MRNTLDEKRKKEYIDYLNSDKWEEKRKLVLKRAMNVCEDCLSRKAEEVHHITYLNFGNEKLYELVALCKKCHHEIHVKIEDKKKYKNIKESRSEEKVSLSFWFSALNIAVADFDLIDEIPCPPESELEDYAKIIKIMKSIKKINKCKLSECVELKEYKNKLIGIEKTFQNESVTKFDAKTELEVFKKKFKEYYNKEENKNISLENMSGEEKKALLDRISSKKTITAKTTSKMKEVSKEKFLSLKLQPMSRQLILQAKSIKENDDFIEIIISKEHKHLSVFFSDISKVLEKNGQVTIVD